MLRHKLKKKEKKTPKKDKKMTNSAVMQLLRCTTFRTHLIISLIIRMLLICYGQWHDLHSSVPYTDIDYEVVTDGARQVLQGRSPFGRHTYRYSPILAYLQFPTVLLHPLAGKFVYATFDLLLAIVIYALVSSQLQLQRRRAVSALLHKFSGKYSVRHKRDKLHQTQYEDRDNRVERLACAAACCWLYNPLAAVISTRGNGDSFSSFFVVLTIYLLVQAEQQQTSTNCLIFAAGLTHGFAIHLRLYPLVFSLAYYLCLSERYVCNFRDFISAICLPSKQQLLLVVGTLLSLGLISGYFYVIYGWQYIYEAYVYHLVRRDARHNFSHYFLMQYLSDGMATTTVWQKGMVLAPQLILIVYLSFGFGQYLQTLPFCIFTLTFVLITFNSVVTSQYFVWYLALMPLCLNNFSAMMSIQKNIIVYCTIWLVSQGLWLLPAYLLEFRTWNTFVWIGVQSAIFFIANCYLLMQFIQNYSFTSFKVNFKKLF